ncbi:Uncharacterized protein HZ326_16375 [Fusarium oxysporum f. sp. albedinis]|nr:Uncharacterized protein HZ326_16375 [Fusarium oxysporum f. sp. albedinis]
MKSGIEAPMHEAFIAAVGKLVDHLTHCPLSSPKVRPSRMQEDMGRAWGPCSLPRIKLSFRCSVAFVRESSAELL